MTNKKIILTGLTENEIRLILNALEKAMGTERGYRKIKDYVEMHNRFEQLLKDITAPLSVKNQTGCQNDS